MSQTTHAYVIYALSAASAPTVYRYVGQTRRIEVRRTEHLASARRGKPGPLSDWIRDLLARGEDLVIAELVRCDQDDLNRRERDLIDEMRAAGADLLNRRQGGGYDYERQSSPDARRKIGDASRARGVSPEARQRISETLAGHAVSDETRARMSQSVKASLTSERRDALGDFGAVGAHNRWHVNRDVVNPNCPLCVEG